MPTKADLSIFWFKRDLRVVDNPALQAAVLDPKILDLEPAIKDKVTADAYTNDIELVISKVEHRKSHKTSVKMTNRASR